jgi:O-antigen/teichoic acid export membrane protein
LIERIRNWIQTVLEFAFAHGLGQAAGMLSGLIFVRLMPVDQYALYALCMTVLGMMSVGSDFGLTGSLSYFWRRGLQTRTPIGPKLAAVRRLRNVFFLMVICVGVLTLVTATRSMPVTFLLVCICLLLIIAQAWLQVRTSVDVHMLRLEGRARTSYSVEVGGNLFRLMLAVGMFVFGTATAFLGLLAGLAGAAMSQFISRLSHEQDREKFAAPTPSDWMDIRAYLLPVFPAVLVYLLRDPLVMWLTAVRAGPVAVAEVFALSRIGMIFALVGSFTIVVLVPKLSGIASARRFGLVAIASLGALGIICLVLILLTVVAPALPLYLIGPQYAHLHNEVVVLVGSASLTVLTSFLVLASRVGGWVRLDPHFAFLQLIVLAGLCVAWRFESTLNVVVLNFWLSSVAFLVAALVFVLGLRWPSAVFLRGRDEDREPALEGAG